MQSEIDAYDGAIAYTDQRIGSLLEELSTRGDLENTLVILTSDHGEAFGEHQLYLHAHLLYREVIEVPLILALPGIIPTGKRIDVPVSNASLSATLLAVLGGENQVNIAGVPLVELWKNEETAVEWQPPLAELKSQPWTPENYPVQNGWLKSIICLDCGSQAGVGHVTGQVILPTTSLLVGAKHLDDASVSLEYTCAQMLRLYVILEENYAEKLFCQPVSLSYLFWDVLPVYRCAYPSHDCSRSSD